MNSMHVSVILLSLQLSKTIRTAHTTPSNRRLSTTTRIFTIIDTIRKLETSRFSDNFDPIEDLTTPENRSKTQENWEFLEKSARTLNENGCCGAETPLFPCLEPTENLSNYAKNACQNVEGSPDYGTARHVHFLNFIPSQQGTSTRQLRSFVETRSTAEYNRTESIKTGTPFPATTLPLIFEHAGFLLPEDSN
jgi:hypothetical protein